MDFNRDLNPLNGIRLMAKMRISDAIKFFFRRYWHAFLFLIYPILMAQFFLLEKYTVPQFWVNSYLDQFIPFWPVFVVPYMLWFPLVAVILVALCFSDRADFARTILLLFAGMAAALMIYLIFPHGQPLRPIVTGDDFFSRAVRYSIYANDTSTNCCPSIHVLNQLAVHIGMCKSKMFRNKKRWKIASLVATILVCASTVLIKQHSILDVIMALILVVPLYLLVFKVDWRQHVPRKLMDTAMFYARKLKLQGGFAATWAEE